MKKRDFWGIGIFIIVLIIVFLNKIVNFIINIKWFKEMGYLSVYFTKISAVLKLMIPIFLICFIGIWFYYKSIKKSIIKWNTVVEVNSIKDKREKNIILIVDALISLFVSFNFASAYWYTILEFANGQSFNVKDPLFNKDISFYIFKLPLIESINKAAISLILFLVFVTIVIYISMNTKDKIVFGRHRDENQSANSNKATGFKSGLTRFAGKQLAVVGSLALIFISLEYAIKAWNLVYSPRGVAFGASYTDTHVTLRFYKIIVVASLISAIVIFISVLKSKVRPIVIFSVLIIALIFSEKVVSGVWENFIVKSNEKRLETPYIEYNIKYTKKGFGIDNIEEKVYNLDNNLNKEVISKNRDTIDNIKINSVSPALEFYNQVESKKSYYQFNDVDIDRYNINGKYTQVFVSARELEYDKLKEKASTWQSKHLIYTHGYGLVMSKVNSVTSEGKPDFVVNDMPIKNVSGIKIDNPRIYFGEKTKEYCIVNTKLEELDYPKESEENTNNKYDGKAGIKMNLFNRILFAINQKDINFLLSRDINADSRILINRSITNRIKKIAPFLMYDKDPYLVVNNGRLYWIIDAYTASNRYPFSEPMNGVNYMRNSAKVIIDTVDGTTNFYIVDKNEPIINTYSKIFPKLFKDINELPKGFKEHFRYPDQYFITQCKVMEKYHVDDADSFFGSPNIWDIAKNQKQVEGKDNINAASYVIMKLPGEPKEEMVLIQYFNQYQRENMIALMAARMDKDNYGKLVLYKLPRTVNSPILFKQKINQDTAISKELSLWNKEGSKVQFGDTMIVPVANSLLYVEPIYLRAQGERSIPEMKRVVVSYEDRMILAPDIETGLKQLFDYEDKDNEKKVIDNSTVPMKNDPIIKQAKELYSKALEAQKSGDWAKYGEYIKKLGETLNNIK
ncbi:UPF0182 family protein [Clostridium brassicae]|uniref:UPF0182 protein OW729_17745 n=1 Tax=Clostridium brassicae TaxID=2999072 RepID=A0ABT4DDQ2_9CLOT|nr:UPF0182 family protein [Clostridium brassicae]MCY6960449.1 UPF0182 family protein [Clostridium brassicae]